MVILLTIEEYLKSKGKTIKTKKKSYKTSLINRTLLTVTIVLVLLITMNINKKTKTYLNKYVHNERLPRSVNVPNPNT